MDIHRKSTEGRTLMTWWSTNQLRLIQNNLRETDANLDVDQLIQELQQFNTNVLMMNAGGIVAFYPSTLEYQYISSSLTIDLLEETIAKAHAAGMRFIARFDFSKAHESIYAKRPEWFYRTKTGNAVNYNGIVHTCLNSYYQQEYSLLMIDEVLSKYPVDGVFFNMFGYKTQDYSGREYGLCYCESCRTRFRDMFDRALPEQANESDPNFDSYKQFQEITTRDMLDRIHDFVKAKNPDVAISTYHHHKVDIIRKESNTALTRSHPVWLYSASENVMSVENSWADKLVSNCSINAIDLQYRFTSVSKYETQIRLYENIAAGSGLDFCIIGQFDDYTDRGSFQSVKEIFQFHRDNEHYFGNLRPVSDVVLIKPNGMNKSASREYLGVFKMLKEHHLMFEVVEQDAFQSDFEISNGVRAVIIPGLPTMEPDQIYVLAQLRESGIHLVATGRALHNNPQGLKQLFGAKYEDVLEQTDAAYVQVDDRSLFPSFVDRDWLIVSGKFGYVSYDQANVSSFEAHLPLVAPSTFGPPERAYGHQQTAHAGLGIIHYQDGAGKAFYYPWSIGELYYKHGYEDHKLVLTDVLDGMLSAELSGRLGVAPGATLSEKLGTNKLLNVALSGGLNEDALLGPSLVTDAPLSVEMFLHELPDGSTILQLINLSGFNGVTYHKPLPIRDIHVKLRGCALRPIKEANLLHLRTTTPIHIDEHGDVSLTLDVLNQYEAIVLTTS
jgi:hypothetical protein